MKSKTVDDYIDSAPEWATEKLIVLRQLALKAGLEESVKWGAPSYSGNGLVLGLATFKGWVSLWFHQGAFLKDDEKKLLVAQEKTKGMRQWRFMPEEEIKEALVLKYIKEAKANDVAGKKIKLEKKPVIIPELLKVALQNDLLFKELYEAMSASHQREYCEYITEAKREATQQRRLIKSIEMIKAGSGLNDKYKK